MIENLTFQTNLYWTQKYGVSIKTNESEIKQFLAIHLIMPIIKMLAYKMF